MLKPGSVRAASARPTRRRSFDEISFGVTMGLLAGVAMALLIVPTVVVLIVSFTGGMSLKFPPPSYSTRWYVSLIDSWQLQFAAMNSLKIAASSTALSILIGVPAALAIARTTPVRARALDGLFTSPLVLPALAFGLSALMYFSLIGAPLSFATLMIGHTVVCVPFVVRTTVASLAQLDGAMLDSSASLGASRFYTFRRVTFPIVRSGVLAGAFLAFMASFDNIPVSLFLADARTDMLPIRLWQALESNLDVRTAAVSGVLIVVTVVLLIAMERFAGLSRQIR
jgi:putative spermidine/putrescine transport system permease protein